MRNFKLGFDLFINTYVVRLIDPGTATSCNGMVHRVPPEVILSVKEMLFSFHASFILNSGNWFYFPRACHVQFLLQWLDEQFLKVNIFQN